MELLITAIVIALVIHGLERNRIRQSALHPHLAGSTDVQDRDTERTSCELLSRA
ncbi:hypothetical protein [Actinophytocola xanthii]|uniref:hypothetical protein n=1 Tax=Actinophytocola xanthii TaxID=1912961 RepID=UPI0013019792|nr:hypothetical protein [Actinophytocola xanthii]